MHARGPAELADDSPQPYLARAVLISLALTFLISFVGLAVSTTPVTYLQVDLVWKPGATERAREYLMAHRGLSLIRPDGPSVSICLLNDASPDNIRGLLDEPILEAVRYVDQERLVPTERREVSFLTWAHYKHPELAIERLFVPLSVLPVFLTFFLATLLSTRGGRARLAACIPVASADAMGAFRIALAISLLPFVTQTIAGTPSWLEAARLVLLLFFGIGLASRLSFAILVGLLFLAHRNELGAHDISLPLKTLALMVVVPWGDGISLDRLIWRRRGGPVEYPDSRRYGMAFWVPTFMLGLGYAAAAFAKIDESGLRWVTGGGVRYFFVLDGHLAPGNLGRLVASSDVASVVASIGALFVEALIAVAAIWAMPIVTLVAGLGALGLHAGFWFMQGIWWWGWWALLPAFLPWQWIAARLTSGGRGAGAMTLTARRARPLQLSVVASILIGFFALQQPVVSLLRKEWGLFSSFPMYSDVNWASKEEFAAFMNSQRQPLPAVRLEPTDGSSPALFDSRLRDLDDENVAVEVARHLIRGEEVTPGQRERLQSVVARYDSRFGSPPPDVRVLTTTWKFDWRIANFVEESDWTRQGVMDMGAAMLRTPATP